MTDIPTSGLISPEVLARALGTPGLVIIDIRAAAEGSRLAFEAAHIPGAVHSDYAADGWRAKVGNAPGMLPPLDHLAELAGRLGITPPSKVVIVPAGLSASDLAAATRVYWTLKLIGHGQQAILDGGFKGWQTSPGLPIETGASKPVSTAPYPIVVQQKLRSTADATLVASRSKLATLVDARSASYFEGKEKQRAPAIFPALSRGIIPRRSTRQPDASGQSETSPPSSAKCRTARRFPIAIPATLPRSTGS
jgi:thiosulfate/3-mercaptopyruvate sulfurtransferase